MSLVMERMMSMGAVREGMAITIVGEQARAKAGSLVCKCLSDGALLGRNTAPGSDFCGNKNWE